jgi:hypothetical protein
MTNTPRNQAPDMAALADELERAYELVDRINGVVDRQTADQKNGEESDSPADAERHVMLTVGDERTLNEGALCLKRAIAMLETERAASPATAEPGDGQPRWRHKKRGTTYTEIGRGELQTMDAGGLTNGEPMVIYRGSDGKLWVRDVVEFEDGRFEFVPPSPAPHHEVNDD